MRNIMHPRSLAAAALAALTVNLAPVAAEEDELPFSQAELFFELNDTDGDLGIHAAIDGEPWRRLRIEDPNGRRILDIKVRGRLRKQGLTQLAFESAEPDFEELDPETFFERFPAGDYEIEGVTLDGEELEGVATLGHVLAAPAENVTVNGFPVPEDCDEDPIPEVTDPVLVTWDPVVDAHPELGEPGEVEIVRYQFFVEAEGFKLSLDLPPSVTEAAIPAGMLASGEIYKLEIIAREANGNNTAVESCFGML